MRERKISLPWTHNQNKEHIDQEESKHQKGKEAKDLNRYFTRNINGQ